MSTHFPPTLKATDLDSLMSKLDTLLNSLQSVH
jgi:hypothetical protein